MDTLIPEINEVSCQKCGIDTFNKTYCDECLDKIQRPLFKKKCGLCREYFECDNDLRLFCFGCKPRFRGKKK